MTVDSVGNLSYPEIKGIDVAWLHNNSGITGDSTLFGFGYHGGAVNN